LSSRRSYDHANRDFIDWYCSEPRLAFSRTVVTRYRIALERRRYAPSTINLRLAAVRRLAYEASDCGLLSPDLAAGIRRVKGAKRLGVRVSNWLSAEQGRTLVAASSGQQLRAVRNKAVLAMLIGCGLCRAEIVTVKVEDFQLREDHWFCRTSSAKADICGPYRSRPGLSLLWRLDSLCEPARVESFSAPLGRVEEELCDGDCHQAACHGFRDRGPAAADRFYED
jgi:integrase